jgi:hypothetical protein
MNQIAVKAKQRSEFDVEVLDLLGEIKKSLLAKSKI